MFGAGVVRGIIYVRVRGLMGEFLEETLSVKINVYTTFHDLGS